MSNTLPRTLCEAFQSTVAAHPNAVALRTADGSTELTWVQYGQRVRAIAEGLAAHGVRPGDTVGIMLTNRPEFHLVDTAVLHLGATPFSIYNTTPPELIVYLFGNAGNKVVVCEEQFLGQIAAAHDLGAEIETIICVDAASEGALALKQVEDTQCADYDFEASWKAVRPEDLLTIVYTSGTTGPPKGVELTHSAIIANFQAVTQVIPFGSEERIVSYLPDAHAANRWLAHWAAILAGAHVTTVAQPKEAIAALKGTQPTIFLGVPHTWYKIKGSIETQLAAASPVRRRLGTWAIDIGLRKARLDGLRQPVGISLGLQHRLADQLVLSKVRSELGLDQMRAAISGAAPIAPEALEFMLALGLPVCEAWGMTEIPAASTINPPNAIRIGTVGKPVPGVEVRLADDGELLVRGPNLMRGYRNAPEKTAEAIDVDGWLHTGDIATIDEDGYVRITDRKKELIINSSGKNMSPAHIEGTVRAASPLFGAVAAIGDQRPYVTVLISLDEDAAAQFAERHGLPDRSVAALAAHPAVRAEVDAAVQRANEKLSRVEQVRDHIIVPASWQPGGDELTPTLKLKRKPIAEKYQAQIDELY